MNVFELSIKVSLKNDIILDYLSECISKVIDCTLSRDSYYLKLHNENCYKNYCFNSLYPIEMQGIYRKDRTYNFQIRTIDQYLATYVNDNIAKTETKFIKVLDCTVKIIKSNHIDKLYSITPIILKNSCGYWKNELTLEDFERRLRVNLIKKYNNICNEKIDSDFPLFTSIEFKNRKPISIIYKNVKLLGDKISMTIADDPISQKIAYMALGTGLCEMSGRGAGYVNFRWL